MIELDWRVALAILLALLWLLYSLLARLGAWRRSRKARARGARAVRGESDAERLLEAHGFAVLERQVPCSFALHCDDELQSFELRADLLVAREGIRYIAEVKTGSRAPSLSTAATRRQLLEYAHAFQSPTILLVDVESERISFVRFSSFSTASSAESQAEDVA